MTWTNTLYTENVNFIHLQLLRKISFNDNLSCPSATKPSQSTIYATQKNHQPSGRRKTASKIAPSPQHSTGILFARSSELNTNLDGLSVDDDDEDHINMNTFSSNKHFRFDNNIKNCFRIQKQNYVPQENEEDKHKSTNNNCCSSSYDMKNSIFVDEEIIFTENKIYISATERNLKQCNSNNKVDKKPFDAIGSNNSNSISSLASIDRNGKCYGKLGFDDSMCASEQIIFEKVKYDANKKYLQPPTSPSNSSEHSTISYELNQYFGNCSSMSTQTNNRLSTYDNVDYEWVGSDDENRNSSSNANEQKFSMKGQQQKQTPSYDNQNEFYLKNSDSWKFFNKQYLQNSKFFDNHNIIRNNTIHYETVSDSLRTSVSTLDTWVDDESFDNSFNEELEKRCTAQVRKLSR